jgi:curli biogenesis system outer membrane secretion channel CsgG
MLEIPLAGFEFRGCKMRAPAWAGKVVFPLRVSLVLLLALGSAAAQDKKRIALYDFDYSAVKSDISASIGPNYNVGKTVSQMFLSPLTESGAYDVIDRDQTERLIKEQNMKYSDRFDAASAPKFGQILGVDAIVTGTVDNVLIETRSKSKGLMGVGHHKTEAHVVVTITAKMVSTESGQIFLAPTADGEATFELGSDTGGGVAVQQKDKYGRTTQTGGTGGMGSSSTIRNPYEPVLKMAIRQAVNKMAKEMASKSGTLPRRNVTMVSRNSRSSAPKYSGGTDSGGVTQASTKTNTPPATTTTTTTASVRPSTPTTPASNALHASVIDVSGGTLFIDKGAQAGVQKGDRFEVRRLVKMVPNSKGKMIRLDKKIGVVEIQEVSDEWSNGKYTGEETAKKDDAVVKTQ